MRSPRFRPEAPLDICQVRPTGTLCSRIGYWTTREEGSGPLTGLPALALLPPPPFPVPVPEGTPVTSTDEELWSGQLSGASQKPLPHLWHMPTSISQGFLGLDPFYSEALALTSSMGYRTRLGVRK